MNNIFRDLDVGDRFDLKGSITGRRELKLNETYDDPNRDSKRTLKDLDFMQYIKQIQLNHKIDDKRPRLEEILASDATFFARTNIIDYSLLLGEIRNSEELLEQLDANEQSSDGIYFSVDGKAYIMGIIDTLTDFK